mmetsp:Transcript_26572/g.37018  ORF Transcript_26572/g.37018 Transcript_26572/m.37018 type:complete len:423 (+) Transcript_26572:76-1344(+)
MLVIVIGGSSFVGRELVASLASNEHLRQYGLRVGEAKREGQCGKVSLSIGVLNRGSRYWCSNSGARSDLPQQVTHVICDRKDETELSKKLNWIQKHFREADSPKKRDIVIVDFCAYRPKHIRMLVNLLKHSLKHYIFVSSDSIYEVCAEVGGDSGSKESDGGDDVKTTRGLKRALRESDAVRPESRKVQKSLKSADNYGHKKLRCEEYLCKKSRALGFTCTSLRLCDVIGPFDNTDRFWSTYLWFKYARSIPIEPAKDLDQLISLTSSWDTVNVILSDLQRVSLTSSPRPAQLCLNVAMEEHVKTSEFLSLIASFCPGSCGNTCPVLAHSSELSVRYPYYPSVTRGPVDISEVKKTLNWSPALSLKSAIERCCNFFEKAEFLYPSDLEDAIKNLPKPVRKKVRTEMRCKHTAASAKKTSHAY